MKLYFSYMKFFTAKQGIFTKFAMKISINFQTSTLIFVTWDLHIEMVMGKSLEYLHMPDHDNNGTTVFLSPCPTPIWGVKPWNALSITPQTWPNSWGGHVCY